MSTKFSAFHRCMLQLRAFCGCSARCRIVDRHVDLLSTVSRVGGCKPSSFSRDTRYLAKDYSSELQACFGVDVRSDVASVHSPFTCVVCHRLLVAPPSLKARAGRDRVCALLSGGSLTLKPAPSAFPSIVEKGHRRKEGKKHYQLLSPCPTPFQQLIHVTVQVTLTSAVRPLSGDCRRSRFAHRNSMVCHHFGKAEW